MRADKHAWLIAMIKMSFCMIYEHKLSLFLFGFFFFFNAIIDGSSVSSSSIKSRNKLQSVICCCKSCKNLICMPINFFSTEKKSFCLSRTGSWSLRIPEGYPDYTKSPQQTEIIPKLSSQNLIIFEEELGFFGSNSVSDWSTEVLSLQGF